MDNKITKSRLKEVLGYRSFINLVFEYTKSGVCTLWVNGNATPFKAGGWGYDKESTVFSEFMNYYFNTEKLLKRKSVKGIYGHRRGRFSYGVGISTHQSILKPLRGFKLSFVTGTKSSDVYDFVYDKELLR